MSVAFWWCHTPECPEFGRARRCLPEEIECHCGIDRKPSAPEEPPAIKLDWIEPPDDEAA